MNSTFLTACVALMTLGIWVGIGFLIHTLLQVRRAALAMEALSYELSESLDRMKDTRDKLFDFATTVRSGWMRALETLVGTAVALWPERRRPDDSKTPSRPAANEH